MNDKMMLLRIKWSPLQLVKNKLTKVGDALIIDDTELLGQRPDFVCLMAEQYGWDYNTNNIKDIADLSLYFKVKDDVILGGVYDLVNQKFLTEVIVCVRESAKDFDKNLPKRKIYIYKEDDFQEIKKLIQAE